jgi:hypothetical protein
VRLRLAALDFQVACFGHNKAIIGDARPGSATGGRWAVPQTPNQATPWQPGERVTVAGNGNSNPATEEVTDDA